MYRLDARMLTTPIESDQELTLNWMGADGSIVDSTILKATWLHDRLAWEPAQNVQTISSLQRWFIQAPQDALKLNIIGNHPWA